MKTLTERFGALAAPETFLPLRFVTVIICLYALCALLLPQTIHAQGHSLRATTPRSRQVLDMTRANETWARQWEVTDTAVAFPDGGRAGFYRRPDRTGDTVPYTDRLGVLYLYPESLHRPARMIRENVDIIPTASRLAMGVCANRRPRGEWILKVFVDGEQTGDDVTISGKDGWQDIAYNLSAFTGRRVDIEIEAHAAMRRAAHAYFDYIRLEDPARQPVTKLMEPGGTEENNFYDPARESGDESMEDPFFFDIYYREFLQLLRDREERRRYNRLWNQYGTGCCPKRP